MNEIEIKKLVSLTVVSSIIVSTILIILLKINILSLEIFKIFSITVTILTLYWAFYFKWGWKMPLLNKIFERPNINGTWIGTYKSEDNVSNQYYGKIVLTVKQSFLFIHFTSLTNKFVSYSYGESLLFNQNENIKNINYFYSQKRFKADEDNLTQGAVELSIIGQAESQILYGDFWTNRHTKGFLKLRFVSSNCVASYQDAEKIWNDEEYWLID